MKEVRKNRSQEVKPKTTCHPAFIAVSHKFVGQVCPTYKYSCHSELVSESHTKIDSQHKEEIPEQVRNDMKGKFLVPQCPSILVPLKKAAFTLAEVLITLGIIGVVAAMTLPALIQHHQKQVTVTSLKKIYSVMSQAIILSKTQNGEMEYWDFPYSFTKADIEPFFDKYFRPYMQVIGKCEKKESCISLYTDTRPVYIFKDGIQLQFNPNAQSDTLNNGQKYIHTNVDINGNKGPNRYGRDIFSINVDLVRGVQLLGQFAEDGSAYGREELKTGIPMNSGRDTGCCSHECTTSWAKYITCGALIQADGWVIKDDYPW